MSRRYHLDEELIQALFSISRILGVYSDFEKRIKNVEYTHRHIDNVDIYSLKGTSINPGRTQIRSLIRDVISDLRFLPGKNTHTQSWHPRGFLGAAIALVSKIEKSQTKSNSLILEGHSLGAAVSLIAASILHRKGYKIQKVYVFGCPNVGNIEHIPDNIVRAYRNGSDIVTFLPPFYKFPVAIVSLPSDHNSLKAHSLVSYAQSIENEITK